MPMATFTNRRQMMTKVCHGQALVFDGGTIVWRMNIHVRHVAAQHRLNWRDRAFTVVRRCRTDLSGMNV